MDESATSPVSAFAELDAEMASAQELRDRTEALAGQAEHEGTSGRFLIGLVTASADYADLDHPFFEQVFFKGIRSRLTRGGCDLLLAAARPSLAGDPVRLAAFERTLDRGVDALIAWGLGSDDPEVALILASGIPTIFIDHDPIGARTGCVISDNVEGMAQVVRHLHALGRRRIAHVTGLQNTRPAPDRLLGYRSELSRLGLEAPQAYVVAGGYNHRAAYTAAQRLLALPEPPDAITAASDPMAVGAMVAALDAGLSVPEDVAVTGFDDAPFAATLRPALTTVRQDSFGIGTAAAEAVLRMLESPGEPPATVVIATELIVRESSGGRPREREPLPCGPGQGGAA